VQLAAAVDLADVRSAARSRLPRPVFDLIDGGADDEITLRRNAAAFDDLALRPRTLVDVAERSLRTEVFGRSVAMPVLLAPTGGGRVAHRRAELAVAAAAAAHGTVYVQSTVTSYRLEDIAAVPGGAPWYQLYLPPTRAETVAMVERVAAAGYRVLVLTVDTPVFGGRRRDVRNGLRLPLRVSPGLVLRGATRPAWAVDFVRGNLPVPPVLARRSGRL
jgi:isopentenyl diphosphate isomerase/L-lactate dehydrogenase-like FMN-dependent dehydrogenase